LAVERKKVECKKIGKMWADRPSVPFYSGHKIRFQKESLGSNISISTRGRTFGRKQFYREKNSQ